MLPAFYTYRKSKIFQELFNEMVPSACFLLSIEGSHPTGWDFYPQKGTLVPKRFKDIFVMGDVVDYGE